MMENFNLKDPIVTSQEKKKTFPARAKMSESNLRTLKVYTKSFRRMNHRTLEQKRREDKYVIYPFEIYPTLESIRTKTRVHKFPNY